MRRARCGDGWQCGPVKMVMDVVGSDVGGGGLRRSGDVRVPVQGVLGGAEEEAVVGDARAGQGWEAGEWEPGEPRRVGDGGSQRERRVGQGERPVGAR